MEISNAHLPSDLLRHNCNTTHLQLYTPPHLSPTLTHVLSVVHSGFEPVLRLPRKYITSTTLGIPISSEEDKLRYLYLEWNARLSDGIWNNTCCIFHCCYSPFPHRGLGNSMIIRIFLMRENFCTYTNNMSFHTTRKADFTRWTRLGDVLITYATCQTLASPNTQAQCNCR